MGYPESRRNAEVRFIIGATVNGLGLFPKAFKNRHHSQLAPHPQE
jgi:hypothetical protein